MERQGNYRCLPVRSSFQTLWSSNPQGRAMGPKRKPLTMEGNEPLVALFMSRIVPASGLALAPWRLSQVAGRSSGQDPHASLDTMSDSIIDSYANVLFYAITRLRSSLSC
jgi:hypothetical protein